MTTPDIIDLLATIPQIGLHAPERELLHRLKQHNHPAAASQTALLDALATLEQQGLVEITLVADLTQAGKQAVSNAGRGPAAGTWHPPFPEPTVPA